jgi:hypothetical protein
VWERAVSALRAGREAWREHGGTPERRQAERYEERWALYAGEAFERSLRTAPHRDPRVYANTRLLWKHVEGVVDFYATTVYQGDLSTDGEPLADGSRGAIPIDARLAGGKREALTRALAALWTGWNWRQNMTLRPMYGAALGDVLTELIDDPARGFVYPGVVWPGYVVEIELDHVGNIERYALEYRVREERPGGRGDEYRYRKEVDREAFRYYRDGRPWAVAGRGSVVRNPYGFVPAVWDRHKVTWGERGASAFEGTLRALLEVNSVLSHGIDFQRKAFAAPIIVKGQISAPGQTQVALAKPPASAEEGARLAEVTHWLQGGEGAGIEQPVFDVGQTLALLEFVRQGILAENPEASFYHELRQMQQVTAPGAERLLGDAVSRCRRARAGYDTGTIKLLQMAISMCGMRANGGDWGRRLTRRQEAFRPYTLASYGRGELDFTIGDRPVVMATEQERLDLIAQKERLRTGWALREAGLSQGEIATIERERSTGGERTDRGGNPERGGGAGAGN